MTETQKPYSRAMTVEAAKRMLSRQGVYVGAYVEHAKFPRGARVVEKLDDNMVVIQDPCLSSSMRPLMAVVARMFRLRLTVPLAELYNGEDVMRISIDRRLQRVFEELDDEFPTLIS